MKNKRLPLFIILTAVSLVCLSTLGFSKKRHVDLSQYDFEEGDILLQHIPSYLGSVIADVTRSQYSHCGLVTHHKGRLYVLEAIGPVVKYTLLEDWLKRGSFERFTQLRPKGLTRPQIIEAMKEAKGFLYRPYDLQYELDDKKIYCSELVYKAYIRGANIEIGHKEPLQALKWQPHEKFLRYLALGQLPLDRLLITPESVARTPNAKLIYSTFPPPSDEPFYDSDILKGTWHGEYTIKGLKKAVATLTLKNNGHLDAGYITMFDGSVVKILEFSISPFKGSRSFSAVLKDERGICARLQAQIRDHGNRIIGTWKDNLDYEGIFSFARQR